MPDLLAKIKYVLVVGLFTFSSYNIIKTTLEIYKSSHRIEDIRLSVDEAKKENERLKSELSYKKTDDFIETEARNKLNMAKKGERIVITPEVLSVQTAKNAFSLIVSRSFEEPNYKKWYQLFLTR